MRISTRKARRLRRLVNVGQLAVDYSGGDRQSADWNVRALLPFAKVAELLIVTMVVDRALARRETTS